MSVITFCATSTLPMNNLWAKEKKKLLIVPKMKTSPKIKKSPKIITDVGRKHNLIVRVKEKLPAEVHPIVGGNYYIDDFCVYFKNVDSPKFTERCTGSNLLKMPLVPGKYFVRAELPAHRRAIRQCLAGLGSRRQVPLLSQQHRLRPQHRLACHELVPASGNPLDLSGSTGA